MPGCSSVVNIGLASEARGSSSTSWRNVWYGPQDTPVPSNAARTSSSERASNHGRRTAAIRSRAPKRPSSDETSWPVTASRLWNASAVPVTSISDFHWRPVSATTITRRPSLVPKSWPNAP